MARSLTEKRIELEAKGRLGCQAKKVKGGLEDWAAELRLAARGFFLLHSNGVDRSGDSLVMDTDRYFHFQCDSAQ
jgi:hypothetical protein